MSTETELKFQIPPAALPAVRQAVQAASGAQPTPAVARRTRLCARYVDTPQGHLARAGVALRLRLEGATWVQTLKAPAALAGAATGLVQRLEHEVDLGPSPSPPTLDISRHDTHPAGAALHAALQGQAAALQVTFETDVQRTHGLFTGPGAQVELALDEGVVMAAGRQLPLCELELELQQGDTRALLALSATWVQAHGLWLDTRTKAERGTLLAQGRVARPARRVRCAPAGAAARAASADRVPARLQAWWQAAVATLLPAASALAGGCGDNGHQALVLQALRRLQRLAAQPARGGAGPATSGALHQALGGLHGRLQAAAGSGGGTEAAAALLREPATTRLWLQLLAGPPHDAPG